MTLKKYSENNSTVGTPSTSPCAPPSTPQSAVNLNLMCTEDMVNCFENLVDEMNQVTLPADKTHLMDPVALKEMAESVCEKCVLRNSKNTSKVTKCMYCVNGDNEIGMPNFTLPPSIKKSHRKFKKRKDREDYEQIKLPKLEL